MAAENTELSLLKIDLMISTDQLDVYLQQLLDAANALISREGIALADSAEDRQIKIMYAAYLHRRRTRQDAGAMPRYLRWALNNRLLHEKMRKKEAPADG